MSRKKIREGRNDERNGDAHTKLSRWSLIVKETNKTTMKKWAMKETKKERKSESGFENCQVPSCGERGRGSQQTTRKRSKWRPQHLHPNEGEKPGWQRQESLHWEKENHESWKRETAETYYKKRTERSREKNTKKWNVLRDHEGCNTRSIRAKTRGQNIRSQNRSAERKWSMKAKKEREKEQQARTERQESNEGCRESEHGETERESWEKSIAFWW